MKKTLELITVGLLILCVIVLFAVLVVPLAILNAPFESYKKQKFNKAFENFLKNNEGKNFFAYNNRKKSLKFITKHVLPNLRDHIEVLYLENKTLQIEVDKSFYSKMIYDCKNYTKFPHLMKVRNGKVIDISINQELFNWKNQKGNSTHFFTLLNSFFER